MTSAELKAVIARALEVDISKIHDDSSAETLEAWDSLGHINIVVALDQALGGGVGDIEGMGQAYSVALLSARLRQAGRLE
jgi:hypothetical protein